MAKRWCITVWKYLCKSSGRVPTHVSLTQCENIQQSHISILHAANWLFVAEARQNMIIETSNSNNSLLLLDDYIHFTWTKR